MFQLTSRRNLPYAGMLGAPSHLVSGDPQNESSSSFLDQYMTFTREQSEYYLVWQKMWLREEKPILDYHGGS